MCFISRNYLLTTLLFLAWHLLAYSSTTQTRGQAKIGTNDVTYITIDEQNDDAISVGKRMLKAQMFDKALVHLNAALEEDPRNHEAYFLRAIAHLLLSPSQTILATAHTKAHNDLDESIRINPHFIAALALRGSLYLKQGQLGKARIDFKEIKRLEPVDVKDLAYVQTLEPVAVELEHSTKLYSSPKINTIILLLTEALVKMLDSLNQNVLRPYLKTLQKISDAQKPDYQELIKTGAAYFIKSRKYTKEKEFVILEAIDRMTPKMGRAIALVLEQDYHEAINVFVQALDECHDLCDDQESSAFVKRMQNTLTDIGDVLDDVIELYKEKDYKGAAMLLLGPVLGISHLDPELSQYFQQFIEQLKPALDDAINLVFVEKDYKRAYYLVALALLKKSTSSNQQLIHLYESMAVAFYHLIITYTKQLFQWQRIYTLSKTIVQNSFNLSQPAVLQHLRTIQLLTAQIGQAKLLYNEQDYQGAIYLLSKAIDKELDVSNEEVAIYLQSMELLVAEFEYAIIIFGKPDYLQDINLLSMVLIRRLYHFNQEASRNLQTIEQLSETIEDADALMIRRDYKGAISLLSSAINISQWDTHLLEMRAECYGAVGHLLNARLDIHKYITLLSLDGSTYFLKISILFYKIGEITSSLDIIKLCLDHLPEDKMCQMFYGYVKKFDRLLTNIDNLLYDKEWDDCVSQANEILQMDSSTFQFVLNVLSHKCHCLTQGGYSSQAQMICSEVLEMDPNNTNALCDKADNFIANKHYYAAIALFWQALDIDNENRRANKGLQHIKKLLKYSEKRNYYKILGVERNANKKQIEEAYAKLSIKLNPDKFDTESKKKLAETKLMDIAAAKEVLTYEIMNDWYFEDMDMDELDDEY